MIARIRFQLNTEGNYAEFSFRIRASEIVEVGEQIQALCMGYELGTGLRATVIAILSSHPGIVYDIERKDIELVYAEIKRLRDI